jgi:hypothetical protein
MRPKAPVWGSKRPRIAHGPPKQISELSDESLILVTPEGSQDLNETDHRESVRLSKQRNE